MKFIIIVNIMTLLVVAALSDIQEEATMSMTELVAYHGYPCEVHYPITSDGYILALHRIPYGKKSGPSSNKKVVLVMHGMLQSAVDWVIPGEENGLAYMLADRGFDVWLANARGTTYSHNHMTLSPNQKEFWDFSWHEIGAFDLPANIDYILKTTGERSLHYVGYSQGTTSYFVMTSTRPEYNQKIKVATLMAPAAYMTHAFSPIIRFIATVEGLEKNLLGAYGNGEFLPSTSLLAKARVILCANNDITQDLCTNALFAISGFSQSEMNATLVPTLMGHTPAGISTKQIYHYAQGINSGYFRQYDYGRFQNMIKYGQFYPPNYNPSQITAPSFIFYSTGDWICNSVDVERLCRELPNARCILVSNGPWNHLDYAYGIHAPQLVYFQLLEILSRF